MATTVIVVAVIRAVFKGFSKGFHFHPVYLIPPMHPHHHCRFHLMPSHVNSDLEFAYRFLSQAISPRKVSEFYWCNRSCLSFKKSGLDWLPI